MATIMTREQIAIKLDYLNQSPLQPMWVATARNFYTDLIATLEAAWKARDNMQPLYDAMKGPLYTQGQVDSQHRRIDPDCPHCKEELDGEAEFKSGDTEGE